MAQVTIKATDGGSFSAYLAMPAKTPAPAIICIQEIFGINFTMRAIADFWASQGYIAIAPDLFWRQEPGVDITDQTDEEWKKAFSLFKGFDTDKGVADLDATLAHVRAMPECTGKVGSVGFCLGGKLAYLMGTSTTADCNVGYYGVGIEGMLDQAGKIAKPMLLHLAEKDGFVPPEAQQKVKDGLAGNANVTLISWPNMDHAFARIGGKPWNEGAARAANGATLAAFKEALG